MKTHNREYFYKYVTADVAKIILNTLNVRCSSPLIFNDPYDRQIPVRFDFKGEDKYIKKIYINFCKITNQNENPAFEQHLLKNKDLFKEYYDKFLLYCEEVNNLIAHENQTNRVFCVSENKTSLLMWSHYAHKHTGAVIKLRCAPEVDSALCVAEKVHYSSSMPTLNIDDLNNDFFNGTNTTVNKIRKNYFLTKSIEWEYEQEWRDVSLPRSDKNYDDIGIFEEELDSIYLGCCMEEKDKEDIIDIIKTKRKNMKIFEAIKDDYEFKLNFNPILYSQDVETSSA